MRRSREGRAPEPLQRITSVDPPHATQAVVSSPAPQVPHYWQQEEPLGKPGPLLSLEGSSGSDPSCRRPLLQPGPWACLLPGAWEMLSQVGGTVGDLGAG